MLWIRILIRAFMTTKSLICRLFGNLNFKVFKFVTYNSYASLKALTIALSLNNEHFYDLKLSSVRSTPSRVDRRIEGYGGPKINVTDPTDLYPEHCYR